MNLIYYILTDWQFLPYVTIYIFSVNNYMNSQPLRSLPIEYNDIAPIALALLLFFFLFLCTLVRIPQNLTL